MEYQTSCGCIVVQSPPNYKIKYCPKHAAAPKLYQELVKADRVICHLCKQLNPQHENCTSCADREVRLEAIAKVDNPISR